jgi:septal ring factor EnvC (AmiA/AmiB activator)
MADKEIKFTDEELQSLKQIQQDYLECQNVFGQIAIQKIALQQQIDRLAKSEEEYAKKYSDTQAKEQEVAKELNDKYGAGNLDPETGVFTPNS